jgi:hypothetical protein
MRYLIALLLVVSARADLIFTATTPNGQQSVVDSLIVHLTVTAPSSVIVYGNVTGASMNGCIPTSSLDSNCRWSTSTLARLTDPLGYDLFSAWYYADPTWYGSWSEDSGVTGGGPLVLQPGIYELAVMASYTVLPSIDGALDGEMIGNSATVGIAVRSGRIDQTVAAVPEPSSLALLTTVLASLLIVKLRHR